jgi:hypothetical protein
MRFYWQMLTWRDVVGWTIAILVVTVAAVGSGYFWANPAQRRAGLSPEWECVYPGKGSVVCHKKPPSPGPTVVKNLPSE